MPVDHHFVVVDKNFDACELVLVRVVNPAARLWITNFIVNVLMLITLPKLKVADFVFELVHSYLRVVKVGRLVVELLVFDNGLFLDRLIEVCLVKPLVVVHKKKVHWAQVVNLLLQR